MSSWESKGPVLAFFCNWAPYRCYMDLSKSEHSIPSSIYPIRVMCAGRVDPAMVLFAFERGAEGVMVMGCKDKECRYGPGPGQSKKMAGHILGLMHILGLADKRFRAVQYASHERDRLLTDMNSFASEIAKLEKSPLGK